MRRGLLLPEGQRSASPEEAKKQRHLRDKICGWARKYPRHRCLWLAEQMASWGAAAAEVGWDGDVNAAALSRRDSIAANATLVLARIAQLQRIFNQHGCSIALSLACIMSSSSPALLKRHMLPALDAMASWPIRVDPMRVLSKWPSILQHTELVEFNELRHCSICTHRWM